MHCIVTCDQLTAAFTGPVHPLPHSIGPLAKSSTMTGQQTSPHWHSLYFISHCNCICKRICQIFVFEFGSTAPTMTGQRRPSPKWLLLRQPKGQLVKHLTIPRCHFCGHLTRVQYFVLWQIKYLFSKLNGRVSFPVPCHSCYKNVEMVVNYFKVVYYFKVGWIGGKSKKRSSEEHLIYGPGSNLNVFQL